MGQSQSQGPRVERGGELRARHTGASTLAAHPPPLLPPPLPPRYRLRKFGHLAYVVGGWPRDKLLGVTGFADVDLATSDALQLAQVACPSVCVA